MKNIANVADILTGKKNSIHNSDSVHKTTVSIVWAYGVCEYDFTT